MRVVVEARGNAVEVEAREGDTCMELVIGADLSPDITLVLRDGRPIPIDSPLEAGASYRLVVVASGG